MDNLSEAARSGDRESTLAALRDKIWDTIFATDSGKDMAALAKRWLQVCSEIGGKERAQLERLRDRIAAAVEASNSGRDVSALSIRLVEVMGELDALPDPDAPASPAAAARRRARERGGPA